ncbi:MAG: NUDIX hydrolase [Acidimicrobiales bacterium]
MLELSFRAPRPSGTSPLETARAIVAGVPSTSPESEVAKGQILDFIADHPDALYRSCLAGHLTGSALVVDNARERVLVMLHRKLGLWLQPGGHADGEGNLAAVALREAEEETGVAELRVADPPVDCDVHRIPARASEPEHLHLDVRYVVLAPADAEASGNHESRALRWATLGQLDELAGDESLRRLARVGLLAAQSLPVSGAGD